MQLRPYVAVVDDDEGMCRALIRLLQSSNIEASAFHLGRDALQAISRREPDCIVIDIELPDFKTLGLLDAIQSACPRLPVIIITAWEDDNLRAKAVARGVAGYFYKPFSDDGFLDAIHASIAGNRGVPPKPGPLPQ